MYMTKNTLLLLVATATILTVGAGCATRSVNNTTSTTDNTAATTTTQQNAINAKTSLMDRAANTNSWATKSCPAPGPMGWFPNLNLQPILSGQFQGALISDIAKNYSALSGSQADALTAVTSTDGKQLIVAYVSCDGVTGQDAHGFTLDGTVLHLVAFTSPDAATGHYLARLPAFSGSNFDAMFLPVGFVAASSRVLVQSKIYDMGAGGSCATTYWMTVDAKTAATTTFSTDPDLKVYGKNMHIVYVTNSCFASDSIHVKDVTAGSDQLLQKVSGDKYLTLNKVEEQQTVGTQTQFVLHYTINDSTTGSSTPATLILP